MPRPADPEYRRCTNCSKKFKTVATLLQHSITVHSQSKPYRCDCCTFRTATVRALNSHKLGICAQNSIREPGFPIARVKKPKCVQCEQIFRTTTGLSKHRYHRHGERTPHGCPVCGTKFGKAYDLIYHLRKHDKTGSLVRTLMKNRKSLSEPMKYKCTFCPEAFWNLPHYQSHLKNHEANQNFNCPLCTMEFPCAQTLKLHSGVHNEEKPYGCDTCLKKFRYRSSFVFHKKKLCKPGKEVSSEAQALSELQSPSNAENQTVIKPQSGQATAPKVGLSGHPLPKQVNPTPNLCAICDKNFEDVQDLMKHLLTHNQVLLRLASQDHKDVMNNSEVQVDVTKNPEVHVDVTKNPEVHADVTKNPEVHVDVTKNTEALVEVTKNLEVQLDMDITNRKNPVVHVDVDVMKTLEVRLVDVMKIPQLPVDVTKCPEVHENVTKNPKTISKPPKKPFNFKCTFCPYRFRDQRYLQLHEEWHQAQKNFKCCFCHKLFGTAIKLNIHYSVHTCEVPFQCTLCLKRFRYNSSLSRHRTEKHVPNQMYRQS